MPSPSWIIRCLPGLSIISLLILAECALEILQTLWFGANSPTKLITGQYPVVAQVLFVSWGLFLHLLATFFPLRLSWRVWKASAEILRANTTHRPTKTVFQKEDDDDSTKQNGFMRYYQLRDRAPLEPDVVHSIIIPSYKEDIQVLEDTLKVLASHQSARSHVLISGLPCHGGKRPER